MSAAPMFHRGDPDSSRLAAEEATRSGRAETHRAIVAELVERFPGSTAGELEESCRLGVVEVRRRLFDLKVAHVVVRGSARRCRMAGNLQATWYPVLAQGELFGGER